MTLLEPSLQHSAGDLRTLFGSRLGAWSRTAVSDGPGVRRAAVVITLYERNTVPHFLMIKRVNRGSNPGQWALPGGKVDAGESAVDAGLRELREETGLVAEQDDVLGLLDDFTASRGIVITPVVVMLTGPRRPLRSPAEVASLHPLPLTALTAPHVPRWKDTPNGPLLQLPLRHDMVVHAPTGAILWQFAEVVLKGTPLRVSDAMEPGFTSR